MYNDTYGHTVGDYCLQKVASILKECIQRPRDLVARYGGEEFAIILPQTNEHGAINIAGKIRENLRQLNLEHSNSLVAAKIVTISIGITSVFPHPIYDLKCFINTADKALYQSKAKGRDRITISKLS